MGRALQQLRDLSITNNLKGCKSLRSVMFSSSSSLERIGDSCFALSSVEEVAIPDGVLELCDGCFASCNCLRRVTFGSSSTLELIGFGAFPMSVSYLCDPVSVSRQAMLVAITIKQPIC